MSFARRLKRRDLNITSLPTETGSLESLAEPFSYGLKVLAEGVDPVLDIVAVHGLNGHRENTWTVNGVNWLRDLLPWDIPHARIFSWGYHASTHSTSPTSAQYFYHHATFLILDLCAKRRTTETNTRPIIFVAHSLGGIVVKSALIHSEAAREGALEEHRSIKLSTYGILFMGTPHQGGGGVHFGGLMLNLASIFVTTSNGILQHLERDSEWLQQQLGEYAPISRDFVTKFAYELFPTPIALGREEMIVPRSSAVGPGAADAESIAIEADHLNMVKYASREDGGYKKVSGYLRLLAEEAPDAISARWTEENRIKRAQAISARWEELGKIKSIGGENSNAITAVNETLPTDSGYASVIDKLKKVQNTHGEPSTTTSIIQFSSNSSEMDASDIKTNYSDSASIATVPIESFVTEFVDDLLKIVESEKANPQSTERLFKALPQLLQSFAFKVGYGATGREQLEVMVFVNKYRIKIAESFNERSSPPEAAEEAVSNIPTHDPDAMPLADKMSGWFGRIEENENDDNELQSEEQGDDDLENAPALQSYKDFISKTPAYQWFVANLQRELCLEPSTITDVETVANAIRRRVCSLPSVRSVSRTRPPETCIIAFEIDWNPLAFVREQHYPQEPHEAIEIAITLTGGARDAQALTSGQYLCQTWPINGEHTMQLVKDVVRGLAGSRHSCQWPDSTELFAWMNADKLIVEASGTAFSLVEVGEQFAWLGAALRPSPWEIGVAYCSPLITDIHVENGPHSRRTTSDRHNMHCKISFITEQKKYLAPTNGQCWHNMFKNPVVVEGYPIPYRSVESPGLELPLNMMAGLAQTNRADTFNGKLFIKGFSTILIPTKCSGGLVNWHLLYSKDGNRLSYLDNSFHHAKEVGAFHLELPRHVVGWCLEVKINAGTDSCNYKVVRSNLPGPQHGCILENFSITGGKFINAGVNFSIGNKDKPIHVSSHKGYSKKINWISKKFVVFWDEEAKRGWLVNGATALLHLVRASLDYNQTDTLKQWFLFKPEQMDNSGSAIDVLMSPENKMLELYQDDDELNGQKTRNGSDENCFRLKDQIEQIFNYLEKMIDSQVDAAGRGGIKLKGRVRKYIEGWDFTDLACEDPPFYPKVSTLQAMGRGWVDIAVAIDAITLFGRGFGDIFQPVEPYQCARWVELPRQKYYLAACASDFKYIMEKFGDPATNTIIREKVMWNDPDNICSPCQCMEHGPSKHSDPVQVLRPWKLPHTLPNEAKLPFELNNRGALIFGHTLHLAWDWKGIGGFKSSSTSDESESGPLDSGIESSDRASVAGGSGSSSTYQPPQRKVCSNGPQWASGPTGEEENNVSASQISQQSSSHGSSTKPSTNLTTSEAPRPGIFQVENRNRRENSGTATSQWSSRIRKMRGKVDVIFRKGANV